VSVQLSIGALAFLAAVCLIAGFAHGALGFGFPIVATPLVALVIDIKSAIALLAPVTLVLVVLSMLRGGPLSKIAREFWYLPLALAAGAFAGTRFLIAAPPEPFLLVLAGVLVLYLNLDRLERGRSDTVARRRAAFGVLFGFVAGAFEAMANVAGPVLLVFFMLLGLGPLQLVQTLNFCFTFSKGAQVATWAASGLITPATWSAVAVLTVPSVSTFYWGARLRERLDAATYRRWLRAALWAMAAMLVLQFANASISSS
jgi:uncharacterized membrane protein YfcA